MIAVQDLIFSKRQNSRTTSTLGRATVALILSAAVVIGSLAAPPPASAGPGADDYPGNLKSAPTGSVTDPWGFASRNCTSFVAWRMNQLLGSTSAPWKFTNRMSGGHWGNANHWDNNAAALGYPVNSMPALGAIAQTDDGSFGHVAVVIAVSGGNVTIEEYNYDLPGGYGIRTVTASSFVYIHVASVPPRNDVAWQQGPTVYTFAGTGLPTIGQVSDIGLAAWTGVGDYNRDGKDDLYQYFAGTDQSIYVLQSNGTSFGSIGRVRGPGIGQPSWAATGDFDGT